MRCGIYVLQRLFMLGKIPYSVVEEAEEYCGENGLKVGDLLDCLGEEWQGIKSKEPFLKVPYIAGMNFGKVHHYVLVEGYDGKWIWGHEECLGYFKVPMFLFRFFWSGIAICYRV